MRNYPIQGESGFFVQGIAGLIVRWLTTGFFGGKVFIINQVHDALSDVHKTVLAEVAGTVKQSWSLSAVLRSLGNLGVHFRLSGGRPSMNKKEKVA